jgi:MFS family permease
VLLTALLSAAGAAIGLTQLSEGEAKSNADTISIVGGILLIVVLAISYYAGGYVAGRMSRFDGSRQGVGVWAIGLLVTVALAVLGAIAGSEYNLFSQLNLPRIPIDEGDLATGAVIALVLVLVATLVAAIAGGKVGERYHRKVDRAGYGGNLDEDRADRDYEGERGYDRERRTQPDRDRGTDRDGGTYRTA